MNQRQRRLCRMYGIMLRAYPRAFRQDYGPSMEQLFRDRLRDHAGHPVLPFLLKIAADWLISVTQEGCSAMRTISVPTVRALMLSGVLLDLALLFFRFSSPRRDVFHGDAQTSFAVLLMYGLIVAWATTNTDPARRVALHEGTRLGLISGALFFVHTTYGNYLQVGDALMKTIGIVSLCVLFFLWLYAGYRASRAGGSAALAGSWAGVVAVLFKVTFAYLFLLTPGPDPGFVSSWRVFRVTSGPALGVQAWLVQQTLLAGGFHLLMAPFFGAFLGAAGGLVTRFRRKPAVALA